MHELFLLLSRFTISILPTIFFFVYYSLSAALDMADGYAARALGQATKFGAVLDMVTDRATTTCLILVLAQLYPNYLYWWLYLVAIDIVSHFAHIISTLSSGKTSHKDVDNVNPLLKIYYTSRFVLAFLCFGNEGFFIMSYLLYHYTGPVINMGPLAPIAAQFFGNQPMTAVKASLWFFFFPIMAIKQLINVIQLKEACMDLVHHDEEFKRMKQH